MPMTHFFSLVKFSNHHNMCEPVVFYLGWVWGKEVPLGPHGRVCGSLMSYITIQLLHGTPRDGQPCPVTDSLHYMQEAPYLIQSALHLPVQIPRKYPGRKQPDYFT